MPSSHFRKCLLLGQYPKVIYFQQSTKFYIEGLCLRHQKSVTTHLLSHLLSGHWTADKCSNLFYRNSGFGLCRISSEMGLSIFDRAQAIIIYSSHSFTIWFIHIYNAMAIAITTTSAQLLDIFTKTLRQLIDNFWTTLRQ